MSDSSQPKSSTDDLLNDILISAGGTGVSSDCITITLPDNLITSQYQDYTSYIDTTMNANTITLTSSGGGPVYTINSIDTISVGDFNINWGSEEWVDSFPDWNRIHDMRSKYPSLDIAMRNLETIYKLVKDDYDNPVPKK